MSGGPPIRDLRVRFAEKVYLAPSGCWIWIGARTPNGYGQIATRRLHAEYAHRLIVELTSREEIPFGMQVDHLCRVRRCVNPLHLEVVTPKVNTRRMNEANGGSVGSRRKRRMTPMTPMPPFDRLVG